MLYVQKLVGQYWVFLDKSPGIPGKTPENNLFIQVSSLRFMVDLFLLGRIGILDLNGHENRFFMFFFTLSFPDFHSEEKYDLMTKVSEGI